MAVGAAHLVLAPADIAWKSCALRIVVCDPRWVPNPARPSRYGRALLLSRVTRVRGRGERDARRRRPGYRGRVGSAADAMRSTPPQCGAGKRARRFGAATSCCVIRVGRNGSPGASVRLTCVVHRRPQSPRKRQGTEPRAISRRVERRRPPTPLVRSASPAAMSTSTRTRWRR